MRRVLLIAAVAVNLGVLGVLQVLRLLRHLGREHARATSASRSSPPLFQIILPIGISFFTFQALSYVIDTYRGQGRACPVPRLRHLSLVLPASRRRSDRAGVRVPAAAARSDPTRATSTAATRSGSSSRACSRRSSCRATSRGAIVDETFAAPKNHSSLEILFAIYGYAIQIYADFSGYTDIAIGIALLLGIRFPPNFDSPYTARSLQDFWRRWHMTLSRFLRDYLYIPLGGSRGTRWHTYRNLMLTMLIGGLWHGAAWTFVVWGGIHGAGLAIEHCRADRRETLGLARAAADARAAGSSNG